MRNRQWQRLAQRSNNRMKLERVGAKRWRETHPIGVEVFAA